MTNLSPAAQAVITASNCAGSRIVQLHIAAALRAVVQELKYFGITEENILAIAVELESAND